MIVMYESPTPKAQINITPEVMPSTYFMLYRRVGWWQRFWYKFLLGWEVENL